MNEAMGPNSRVCPVCAKIFEKAPNAKYDICPSCLEKLRPQEIEQPLAPRKHTGLKWFLIVIGLAATISQVARIKSALALLFPPPPIGASAEADPRDLCVANLWQISALIQNDKWPAPEFSCPLTHADYITQSIDGDTVVSCPNPQSHGLKSLRVSKKIVAPEMIQ